MTARERFIARKILDVLHAEDGGQLTASQIHSNLGGLVACSAAELDGTMMLLDAEKFINGVPTRFNPKCLKFNITDAGEGARLQL